MEYCVKEYLPKVIVRFERMKLVEYFSMKYPIPAHYIDLSAFFRAQVNYENTGIILASNMPVFTANLKI